MSNNSEFRSSSKKLNNTITRIRRNINEKQRKSNNLKNKVLKKTKGKKVSQLSASLKRTVINEIKSKNMFNNQIKSLQSKISQLERQKKARTNIKSVGRKVNALRLRRNTLKALKNKSNGVSSIRTLNSRFKRTPLKTLQPQSPFNLKTLPNVPTHSIKPITPLTQSELNNLTSRNFNVPPRYQVNYTNLYNNLEPSNLKLSNLTNSNLYN